VLVVKLPVKVVGAKGIANVTSTGLFAEQPFRIITPMK
jgi:hypothetical protein